MKCVLTAGAACDAVHAARYMTWTSFNMVASITQGATAAAWGYGAEHQRYKMCTPNCTAPSSTTLYVYDPATGGTSELVTSGTASTWHDWIVSPDGQIVAERVTPAGSHAHMNYFVNDHLGSVTAATDGSGAIVERDSYDAWGKRRYPDGSDDPACAIASVTTRGYTGHEMLDQFCLIDMNGRIYDPVIAKFLSADDRVPNPFDLQSLNRYAYANDNPLNTIDPTGHSDTSTTPAQEAQDKCYDSCDSVEQIVVTADAYREPPPDPLSGGLYRNPGFSRFGGAGGLQSGDRGGGGGSSSGQNKNPPCGDGTNGTVECVTVTARRLPPLLFLLTPTGVKNSTDSHGQCPGGPYHQVIFGGNGTVAVFFGVTVSFVVGESYPATSNSGISGTQFFASFGIAGHIGLGAFLGAGVEGGIGGTNGLLEPGFSPSAPYDAEAEAGYGFAVGANGQGDPNGGGSVTVGLPIPKLGAGIGGYAGLGRAGVLSLATGPMGC